MEKQQCARVRRFTRGMIEFVEMSIHIVTAIVVIAALATIWDVFFDRGRYLKIVWRWTLRQAAHLRVSRAPAALAIPKTPPTRVPVFPDPALPLHTPDGVHKELVKYIFSGQTRLMAYRVTRDGFSGDSYLVEWQRPNQNPKSMQTRNRAQANDQWLNWYQEWKRQPGSFGGASGTGLDGTPPFNE